MTRRPPPLQLLPAFEAAARLLSFSKAAAELHVTASAVSQQVKQLEEHLGLTLFRRLTRRIELTDAGADFARVAARLMAGWRTGHDELLRRHGRPVLRISAFPMAAHELLLPALAGFQQAHPGTDLQLDSSMELLNFDLAPVDAAVRVGLGPWPGVEALPLADCAGTLVTSPELARRLPVTTPADLRDHVLIHQRLSQVDWDAAAAYVGLERIPRKGELLLDSDLAAQRAAEQGLGVAIGLLPMVNRWLAAGRLVALIPPVPLPHKIWFVMRPADPRREQLLTVYRWLQGLFAALPEPTAIADHA